MNNFYIAESGIHGKGVFAAKSFSQGEEIGKMLTPVWEKDRNPGKFYGYSDASEKLGTLVEKTLLEMYMNHDSDPNAEIFLRDGKAWLKAIKNIKPADEVTVNYQDAFKTIDELQEEFAKKIDD